MEKVVAVRVHKKDYTLFVYYQVKTHLGFFYTVIFFNSELFSFIWGSILFWMSKNHAWGRSYGGMEKVSKCKKNFRLSLKKYSKYMNNISSPGLKKKIYAFFVEFFSKISDKKLWWNSKNGKKITKNELLLFFL